MGIIRKIEQYFWDNVITVLGVSGLGVGLILIIYPSIWPKGKEFEAAIGSLVLYFGILYNVLTYKISADKFSKELFNEFNARFDNMNEDLNKIIQSNSFTTKGMLPKEKIIDYLNLCAEEYYWYKKGMIFYLKDPTFNAVVENQRKEKDSYYGLYEELRL
jgi:hypothetical protein